MKKSSHLPGTPLAYAVKYTVMMNMAPIFLKNNLHLGTCAGSAALRNAPLRWCYSSSHHGASSTTSAGNGTGADDDDRMQVNPLKKGKEEGKGKHQNQKGANTSNTSKTDVNTCKNCGSTGNWVKDCWRPGGGAYGNSNNNTNKGKNNKKNKSKG